MMILFVHFHSNVCTIWFCSFFRFNLCVNTAVAWLAQICHPRALGSLRLTCSSAQGFVPSSKLKKKRNPLPTSPERGNFCGDELPAVPHSEASNIIAEKLSDERPQCIMGCLLGPGTINLINYSLPLRRRKSPNRSVGHSFSHSLHLMWCQELILISKLRRQIYDQNQQVWWLRWWSGTGVGKTCMRNYYVKQLSGRKL